MSASSSTTSRRSRATRTSLQEAPQPFKVSPVRLAAIGQLGRLQHGRQPREAAIANQATKRGEPERALARMGVPVDPAAQPLFRIVQVKRAQPLEPDHPVELAPHAVVIAYQIVAGRNRVAGVEADAQPLALLGLVTKNAQVL